MLLIIFRYLLFADYFALIVIYAATPIAAMAIFMPL